VRRWSTARCRRARDGAQQAHQPGRSRRTVGSPPVRRTRRTPSPTNTRTSAAISSKLQHVLARRRARRRRRGCSTCSCSCSDRSPRCAGSDRPRAPGVDQTLSHGCRHVCAGGAAGRPRARARAR
jgi:hypothetical protein